MADGMDDDDDFGFYPSGKSRLSNLFPSQAINEADVNQSLTFVPPKQPRKNDDISSSNLKGLQLIHAVAGFAYKLEDGNYTNQGKLGTAILGDHVSHSYVLLLYKGKQQQVSHCVINDSFQFTIEPKNYVKFPDNKGEQWSMKFTSEEILIQLAKEVAIAKANSSGNPPTKLIVQDLVSGEGNAIGIGDSIDITFTGHLFRNHVIGEVFDDNTKSDKLFVVCLGKTNVIKGMSEGLIGCQREMRRLLIIPSNLAYGVEGYFDVVPPNQTLVFEILVNRVKFSREKSRSPSRGRSESEVKPEVPIRSLSTSEDTIRSRGASISEQLTQSPRKDNAKIISRMAKMGMPLLPVQGVSQVTVHTSSESETEKEMEPQQPIRTPNTSQKTTHAVSVSQSDGHYSEARHSVKSVSSTRTASPQIQAMPFPAYTNAVVHGDSMPFFQPAHPMSYMATPTPSLMDTHMPLLVAETRTQNTEVRLMLVKINDKLESIMPKIDELKPQYSTTSVNNQAPYMDSMTLAQNIDRIIQENHQLKQDNESKTTKIQELNEKVCDILQRNQRFFEESNSILEQRSDSLQVTTSQLQQKILVLEQEKNKSSAEMNEAVSNLNKSQLQLLDVQRTNTEYKDELEALQIQKKQLDEIISDLQAEHNNKEKLHCDLDVSLNDLKMTNASLVLELQETHAKVQSISKEKENLEVTLAKAEQQSLHQAAELVEMKRELQTRKDVALQWKSRYDTLHENTRILKEKYEAQTKALSLKVKEMKSSLSGQNMSEDFSTEMRKTMNSLYKQLQSEIDESKTYPGKEVLQLSLDVIRRVTLRIIGMGKANVQSSKRKNSGDRLNTNSSSHSPSPTNIQEGLDHPSSNTHQSNDTTHSNEDGRSSSVDKDSTSTARPLKSSEGPSSDDKDNASSEEVRSAAESSQELPKPIISNESSSEVENKIQESTDSSTETLNVQVPDTRESEVAINTPDSGVVNDTWRTDVVADTHNTDIQKTAATETRKMDVDTDFEQEIADSEQQAAEKASSNELSVTKANPRYSPQIWRPQPPTPPLFDDNEEDEDDWLK